LKLPSALIEPRNSLWDTLNEIESMERLPPILVVDRFPRLLDALLDLLRGLSTGEWGYPTVAAGWTVKDVALHLLGGDVGILSGGRDGFSESRATMGEWDELVAWINGRNADWVQSTRRIGPQLLCDLLRFTGDQVNAYFSSLDMHATGAAVSWAGPESAPVWLDLAREFTERWHHQQHIRDAVGKPGVTSPYYLAPVLAAFVHALPQTYRQVDAAGGTCISLTISGEAGGTWSVVRQPEGWELYTGKPEQPQAEIVLPEQIAWRVFTKGMGKDEARRWAKLHGDPALAEKMLETIAIIA
jgi:uncharacterized protein (TIGR03083 family)